MALKNDYIEKTTSQALDKMDNALQHLQGQKTTLDNHKVSPSVHSNIQAIFDDTVYACHPAEQDVTTRMPGMMWAKNAQLWVHVGGYTWYNPKTGGVENEGFLASIQEQTATNAKFSLSNIGEITTEVNKTFAVSYYVTNIGVSAGEVTLQLKNASGTVQSQVNLSLIVGESRSGNLLGIAPADASPGQVWRLEAVNTSNGITTDAETFNVIVQSTPLNFIGDRGVYAAGYDVDGTVATNTIEYITVSTEGSATDFGDLAALHQNASAMSNATIGVFLGGSDSLTTSEYITFNTEGDAASFGTVSAITQGAGCSNGTRGLSGGTSGATEANTIVYITIASPGAASDFGDLTVGRNSLAGVSSLSRGVFAGGVSSNVIDYVVISTLSNAVDFGDLVVARGGVVSLYNNVKGVFCGGNGISLIDVITIASGSNATSFGNITYTHNTGAGLCNSTRGVVVSGGSAKSETITFATMADATEFGDSTNYSKMSGCSGNIA